MLTSSEPWSTEGTPDLETYSKIVKTVDEFVARMTDQFMARNLESRARKESVLDHLLLRVREQNLHTRKPVFRFQSRKDLEQLFVGVDEELRGAAGFLIQDVLAVEAAIEQIVTSRGDAWWRSRHDALRRFQAAVRDNATELSDVEMAWFRVAREVTVDPEQVVLAVMMQWWLSTSQGVFAATTSEVAKAAALDERVAAKVLARFALRRPEGEIGDSAPSLYEPLELQPLVQLSGMAPLPWTPC